METAGLFLVVVGFLLLIAGLTGAPAGGQQ